MRDTSLRPGTGRADNAGVVVRPPLLYLAAIAAGLVAHRIWPVHIVPPALGVPAGLALSLAALLLFVLSIREFRTARTSVKTYEPTSAIITTGPYRFSRNPIYLSFTVLQLGVALSTNSLWVVATLVPTLLVMSHGVIDREERYLAGKFGEPYLRYRATVRRWL